MNKLTGGLLAVLVIALIGLGVYSIAQSRSTGTVGEPSAVASTTSGLATAETPLGTVVTDDGFTLYRFDKDTPKPPKSNCNGACATMWPPVIADGGAVPQINGVDANLVGVVVRADGSMQVTVNGWALYRFAQDTAPGDTKGEGVGGTWHAIGVDGKPATASSALATAQTPLGTVITEKGFTLYRFDKDTPKPPKSNCNGECATAWPPVIAPGGKAPQITGVDAKLVGTVARADGSMQVTVNGWPVYRFAKDAAPGDTKGEGVGGIWHAIGVDGKPAAGSAAKPAPAPAPQAPMTKAPAPRIPTTQAPGGGGGY